MEPLIRRSGIDTAVRSAQEKFALEAEVHITVFAVEQRSKGRVKTLWVVRENG
jgi:hypothetical protein